MSQGADKIRRKGGPGITRSDLQVINNIDLGPYTGVSLKVMEADALLMRKGRPLSFKIMKRRTGIDEVVSFILSEDMVAAQISET